MESAQQPENISIRVIFSKKGNFPNLIGINSSSVNGRQQASRSKEALRHSFKEMGVVRAMARLA